MQPAGTLATGTITMPAAPADGMTITFSSSQQITALTVQGNTGQSMSNAVTFLPGKTAASYVYRLSNTTWYPMQTVPGTGSQLVSGAVQNSTSGTSIDFTNIPSWVKRITVMFNGVSTSGNSAKIIQLGDSGGVETSGYIGTGTVLGNGSGTSTAMSSGFFASQASAATDVLSGQATISLLDSATNTWAYSGVFGQSTATAIIYWSGGAKPLSATLDRVRITTVGSPATDTFDLGSINIMYE
jgi:hypothetical protein